MFVNFTLPNAEKERNRTENRKSIARHNSVHLSEVHRFMSPDKDICLDVDAAECLSLQILTAR
jgi:hypothetical protein